MDDTVAPDSPVHCLRVKKEKKEEKPERKTERKGRKERKENKTKNKKKTEKSGIEFLGRDINIAQIYIFFTIK